MSSTARDTCARSALLLLCAAALALPAGCSSAVEKSFSRTDAALGTMVTVTAWGTEDDAVEDAVAAAFDAMGAIELELNAHDPESAISRFNERPYEEQPLPPDAVEILDAVEALGVTDVFAPALLSVTRLYGFETTPTVPAPGDLALALAASRGFHRTAPDTSGTVRGSFQRLGIFDERIAAGAALAPGLDLGGAAKGLALERARETLEGSGVVSAAIISTGSTTLTLGAKPDGSPWRIGVEDPRDPEATVAVVELEGTGSVSTTGDYQRSFEVDGVLYHHILDPATGEPAPGVRSMTVVGTIDGLASDILSTSLFVMGPDRARDYAADHGLGLVVVDARDSVSTVPAPKSATWSVDLEQPAE